MPLGPAVVNLTGVRAGDRNEFTMTLTSGGVPVNLTGHTVTAAARKKAEDVDPPACTAVVTVTDAVAGQLTVAWPGDAVRAMLGGAASWAGVWDLQSAPASGDPVTLVAGTLTAVMDVTR